LGSDNSRLAIRSAIVVPDPDPDFEFRDEDSAGEDASACGIIVTLARAGLGLPFPSTRPKSLPVAIAPAAVPPNIEIRGRAAAQDEPDLVAESADPVADNDRYPTRLLDEEEADKDDLAEPCDLAHHSTELSLEERVLLDEKARQAAGLGVF